MNKPKDTFLYKILRPIFKFLFHILYTPKFEGLENIPKSGGVVLAGNHTHNLDCAFLISSTKRPVHFLTKDELFKGPPKYFFQGMGLIPVNRKIHDKGALNNAIKYLESDLLIGIFPEGTTRKGLPHMREFKIGAVKMAYETKCPIVPFVITGKYKLFSKDLKIKYLAPIMITNEDLSKENDRLYNIINNELDEDVK